MNAAKNYSILEYLAKRCGYILAKPQLVSFKIDDEINCLGTYQDSTITAIKTVKDFFNNPTKATFEKADKALYDVMSQSVSLQKYNKKKIEGQFEMEF
jgi:hypothetical protein